MFRVLAPVFVTLIFGLPLALGAVPAVAAPRPAVILISLVLLPITYTTAFVVTAGCLSRPFQKHIVPGRFPRQLTHPVYRARRLYGLCWTCLYYTKPVYHICLSVPALKWVTFRLFGYRGQLEFTVYPDTWIRDLPLLDFGRGAYVSNRATLGTNMALSDGTSLVDAIRIGSGTTVGHLAMLAPGVEVGDGTEIGAGTVIGVKCTVAERSLIQPACQINHMVTVGRGVTVGSSSYVGAGAVVGDGVRVKSRSVIPNGVTIRDQEMANSLPSLPTTVEAARDSRPPGSTT